MQFSKHIPDILMESPNTWKFIQVLQGAYDWKREVIGASLRGYNASILTNKRRLIEMLKDLGFEMSYSTPLLALQQLLLNAEVILSAKGSLVGLEMLISVLTFGEAIIDTSRFFSPLRIVIPNSNSNGYILEDTEDTEFFLVSNSRQLQNTSRLSIDIHSPIINEEYWEQYEKSVRKLIYGFIPFGETHLDITYTLRSDKFVHRNLNKFFV